MEQCLFLGRRLLQPPDKRTLINILENRWTLIILIMNDDGVALVRGNRATTSTLLDRKAAIVSAVIKAAKQL